MYATRLGAGRAAALNPLADLAAAGVPLAFGSDSPVTPVDPWAGVRAAVQHRAVDQRISARAAFRASTRGGWRVAGLDHTGAGELRVGCTGPPRGLARGAPHRAGRRRAVLVLEHRRARRASRCCPTCRRTPPRPVCLRTVRGGVVLHDTL